MAFEGPVAVWHGPEDYHHEIDQTPTTITDKTILVMLGAGPIGECLLQKPVLPGS